MSVLQEKLKDIQLEYNKSFYDKSVKVLVENQSTSNPRYFFGRTPFMQSVYLESDRVKIGEEMDVKITSCNHKSLYGIAWFILVLKVEQQTNKYHIQPIVEAIIEVFSNQYWKLRCFRNIWN